MKTDIAIAVMEFVNSHTNVAPKPVDHNEWICHSEICKGKGIVNVTRICKNCGITG